MDSTQVVDKCKFNVKESNHLGRKELFCEKFGNQRKNLDHLLSICYSWFLDKVIKFAMKLRNLLKIRDSFILEKRTISIKTKGFERKNNIFQKD